MGVKKRGRWMRKGSRLEERAKEKRENWCAFLCYYAKKRACVAKQTWSKERWKVAEVVPRSGSGPGSGSRPNWHWDWSVQGWIARNGDDQDKARAWPHSVFVFGTRRRKKMYLWRALRPGSSSGRGLMPTAMSRCLVPALAGIIIVIVVLPQ